MRDFRFLIASAAVAAAPHAQALDLPDCAALRVWGAGAAAEFAYAPGVTLPGIFAADTTARRFGAPVTAWTAADARALDGAVDACGRDARKARDTGAANDFKALRGKVASATRALKNADAARETATKALAGIDGGPQTAQLLQDMGALAATDDAALKGFRTNLRDIGALARAMGLLPAGEGGEVRAALTARAGALAASLTAARVAALAAIPPSPEGVLQARAAAFEARRDMGAAAAATVAAAAARERAIVAALAAETPAPMAPPACGPFLSWAAAADAETARRTRAGMIRMLFETPAVAAVFGKPFAEWTPADVALLTPLARQCGEAARAGLLDGDPKALERAASQAGGLARRAEEQAPRFAALAAARAEADRIAAAAPAAPEGADGFVALATLAAEASRAALEPEDAARVDTAIAARRAALIEAALAEPRAALAAAPATLAGLEAAQVAYMALARGPLAGRIGQDAMRRLTDEALARLATLAPGALPEFEAAVAAVADDETGLRALDALAKRFIVAETPTWAPYRTAVKARRDAVVSALVARNMPQMETELAALPETAQGFQEALARKLWFERAAETESPAFAAYAERAALRAEALRAATHAARCAPAIAAADLSDKEAALPVLAGETIAPLGRLICALADGAPRHDGPGLFDADHVIAFTGPEGFLMKITLREAEVRPGVTALIGRRIDDPNGGNDISAAEWVQFVQAATDIGGADACAFAAGGLQMDRIGEGALDAASMGALADCLLRRPEAEMPSARRG